MLLLKKNIILVTAKLVAALRVYKVVTYFYKLVSAVASTLKNLGEQPSPKSTKRCYLKPSLCFLWRIFLFYLASNSKKRVFSSFLTFLRERRRAISYLRFKLLLKRPDSFLLFFLSPVFWHNSKLKTF